MPIKVDYDFSDLLKDLNATLMLVIGSKLGAINQSKLNFEFIAKAKLDCLGYIYNEYLEKDEATSRNRRAIIEQASKYKIKELAVVKYLKEGIELAS